MPKKLRRDIGRGADLGGVTVSRMTVDRDSLLARIGRVPTAARGTKRTRRKP